jgi:hypothetical protein
MSQDLNSWLPSQFKVRFPSVKTGGTPSYTPPPAYVKTVNVTDSSVGLITTYPNIAGNGFPLIVHDTAPATFTSGTLPTNQVTLDALAVQLATDFWTWRLLNHDIVYNGVIYPVASANGQSGNATATVSAYDWLYEWSYTGDDCTTRIMGSPYNGQAEEFQHALAMSPCTSTSYVAWGTANGAIPAHGWGRANITFDNVSFQTVFVYNPYGSQLAASTPLSVGRWDCNWLVLGASC